MNFRNLDEIQIWWRDLDFSRNQRWALAALAGAILAVSWTIIFWPDQPKPMPAIALNIKPPKIIIDITGEVAKPGVYELSPDSRVIDAIEAAGKAKSTADLSLLNLARPLKDGEQIFVDRKYSPTAMAKHMSRKASNGNTLVNINRATAKELDRLPGIGPVIAQRIIDYRNLNGTFTSIDDLRKVSGIGDSKFEKIRNNIRV